MIRVIRCGWYPMWPDWEWWSSRQIRFIFVPLCPATYSVSTLSVWMNAAITINKSILVSLQLLSCNYHGGHPRKIRCPAGLVVFDIYAQRLPSAGLNQANLSCFHLPVSIWKLCHSPFYTEQLPLSALYWKSVALKESIPKTFCRSAPLRSTMKSKNELWLFNKCQYWSRQLIPWSPRPRLCTLYIRQRGIESIATVLIDYVTSIVSKVQVSAGECNIAWRQFAPSAHSLLLL